MPVNISESAKRMAMQSAAESEKECIERARNLVAKASVLAVSTERKTQLLDLLEVFRDFTEQGRVNKHGLSVLANTSTAVTPTWNVTTTPVLGPFPSKFRSESSETTSQTLYLRSWSSPGLGCGVQPC
jgi:phosphoribosylformylglycinamidine (FGAM) synthase-like enzyme